MLKTKVQSSRNAVWGFRRVRFGAEVNERYVRIAQLSRRDKTSLIFQLLKVHGNEMGLYTLAKGSGIQKELDKQGGTELGTEGCT